jgi:hypothetical protein
MTTEVQQYKYPFCGHLAELSSIALAHISQYFSIIIAPSVLYLTNLVASSPHPIQNLEFFSELDVKGSILFNFFSNNHIFPNYIERRYIINHIEQLSVSAPRLLGFQGGWDSNSLGKVI